MTPVEFHQDLRRHIKSPGLSCGVIIVILRSAVLVELRLVTDRQTDGRTDRRIGRRRCTAYTALASLFADKLLTISVRSSTKQQCLIIGVIGHCYVGVVSTNLVAQ